MEGVVSRVQRRGSPVREAFQLTQQQFSSRTSESSRFPSVLDDLHKCTLCNGRLNKPRVLTCSHTFCEQCLDNHIARQPGHKRFFPCPICRELNPAPPKDESVRSLPPVSGRSSGNESIDRGLALARTDKRCDPCSENDEHSVAMFWCPTCREHLCEMCTRSHRGMRITKSHALMDIEDQKERPLKMLSTHEPCPDHRGKLLDLYCQNHNCPVCTTCVTVGHRRCDTVAAVDKMARTYRNKKTTSTLVQRLKQCINAIEGIMTLKEKRKKRIISRKESILDEISKLKNDVMQLLDELEEKMRTDVDAVCRDYEEVMQSKVEKSLSLRDSIRSSVNVMENTIHEGNDYQYAITTQTMRDEVDKYETMVDEERMDFKDVDLVFSADDNLIQLLKSVDRLGYVDITEKKQMSKAFRNCSAQKEGTLNGRIKGDKTNSIFNSVDIADNGDIIMSDFNNMAVKLFDQHGMFRSTARLNTPPRGVSFLPNKVVVIALPEECVLKIMSYEGKYLSQIRELHTAFKAYQICNFQEKLMGICYAKTCRSLSIVEKNGRVERTISRKRDYKGLGGVAYDPIKNQMYMSDRDTVIGFNGTGRQLFKNTYRRSDLRGMTLDCQGNIYVCSHDSGQVLQISPEGKLIKSILVPMSPQDVAIEPMGNKMVVVGLGDVIHVYSLV